MKGNEELKVVSKEARARGKRLMAPSKRKRAVSEVASSTLRDQKEKNSRCDKGRTGQSELKLKRVETRSEVEERRLTLLEH